MAKKNFKIQMYEREDSEEYIEVDLREELKRRLQLNIIDGELYDRVIYAFENNFSVSSLFAENSDVIKACNVAQENFFIEGLDIVDQDKLNRIIEKFTSSSWVDRDLMFKNCCS
jgi:hypothetical protein